MDLHLSEVHVREQAMAPFEIMMVWVSSPLEACAAAARRAPTMITEEMALVTAISGVCSAGVTLQTT